MSRLLQVLDARNTPIWLKLLLGVGLVVLLVLIPATLVIRSAVEELASNLNSTTVSTTGAEQITTINNSISLARASLDAFVANDEINRQLQGMLLRDVRTADLPLPRTSPDEIEVQIERSLLNPASGLYEFVRVLDRDGNVVASTSATIVSSLGGSNAEANRAAFTAAQAGVAEGRTQTLTVAPLPDGGGALDYTTALLWRDGRPLGYVVGRMSNARVIYPGLRFPAEIGRELGFSYLVSSTGDLITFPDSRIRAEALGNINAARAAFAGNTGVSSATGSDGTLWYVFNSTVPGAPLALSSQLDSAFANQQLSELLSVRRFVIFGLSAALGLVGVFLLTRLIAAPINRLRQTTARMAEGDLATPVPDTKRGDEIGGLARETAALGQKVNLLVSDLENRVIARNRDIAATQEIARTAASQVNLQTLMDRVVDLIVASFPALYHAQIFLVDSDREYAVLRASTGEPGRQLLRRGHRLAVGSQSVIGQVTDAGDLVVARDTAASPVHRRNEFLPDTRAELAIPLKVGTLIIGALDVQSRQPDVFTPDLISALQTMADQVSITIQNARLFEEVSRRAVEVDEANKRATLAAWQDFMRDQRALRLSQSAGIKEADTDLLFAPLRQQALDTAEPVIGELTARNTLPVVAPVVLRGQALGTVEWEVPAQSFGAERLSLAQELAGRLAISLENARLFQESRRSAERERLVNSISARITSQTSIEQILQTAVREVGQALRTPQVSIRLRDDLASEPGPEPASDPNGSAEPAEHPWS
jgi:GAF domain-containing protein/HAMP domain-containing protein